MNGALTLDDLWRLAYFVGPATLEVGGGHDTINWVRCAGRIYTIPDDTDELLAAIEATR